METTLFSGFVLGSGVGITHLNIKGGKQSHKRGIQNRVVKEEEDARKKHLDAEMAGWSETGTKTEPVLTDLKPWYEKIILLMHLFNSITNI